MNFSYRQIAFGKPVPKQAECAKCGNPEQLAKVGSEVLCLDCRTPEEPTPAAQE